MSMTMAPAPVAPQPPPTMTSRHMRRPALIAVLVASLALGAVVWLPFGGPALVGWAIASMVFYMITIGIVSRVVEGRRQAVDRIATAAITSAFLLVLLPLVSLVWTVIKN